MGYFFKLSWNLGFKYLIADIRQVFLRKVDDFVGVLVAYIHRPVNDVVGRVVLRPQAAIYGHSQYVHIVLIAVKRVWHDHCQSVLAGMLLAASSLAGMQPAFRYVQRRAAVYTLPFLLVGLFLCHRGRFSVGRNLDSNSHLLL